jgi:hypothetical protein
MGIQQVPPLERQYLTGTQSRENSELNDESFASVQRGKTSPDLSECHRGMFRPPCVSRHEKQFGGISRQQFLFDSHSENLAQVPPEMRYDAVRETRLRLGVQHVLQFVSPEARQFPRFV